jgi:hypothetical protein
MSVSIEARNNAARRRDEDLAACAAYVETEAGATGQQNADVLGRLLTDAQVRIDELERVLDAIKHSLENVVAGKLHELRQLPERVEAQGVKIAGLGGGVTALTERLARVESVVETMDCGTLPEGTRRDIHGTVDVCTACGHAAENHGGLGSVCLIGSCDCLGYTYTRSDG